MLHKKLIILSSALLLGLGGMTVGATTYFNRLNLQTYADQIYSCTLTWDKNNQPDMNQFISQASRVMLEYSEDIEIIEGQHVGLHNNSFIKTTGNPYDSNVGGFVNNLSKITMDFDNTNGLLLIDVWNKNEDTGVESEKETYFATQTGTVTFNQLANNMMPNQFKIYRGKNGNNIDNVIPIKSITVVCNPIMVPLPPPIDKTTNSYRIYEDYFTNKEYKEVLNLALKHSILKELNYLRFDDSNLVKHYPNLMAGLLKTNEYGVLVKDLATSIRQENDNQRFTIEVKNDVPWMQFDGKTQYCAMNNGEKIPQYVSAQDFVTSAEAVLNYKNFSKFAGLYIDNIVGALEYNKFTYIRHQIYNGSYYWRQFETVEKFTEKLNSLISEETGKPSNIPATEKALKDIQDFKNVGVKATTSPDSNGGGKIEYILKNSNINFIDLLAHNAFYPANAIFLKEKGFSQFGKNKDYLLYNGPFVLTESTGEKITYEINTKYHDVDNVTTKKVNFIVTEYYDTPSISRELYENSEVDMFELDKNDTVGYEKYVTGTNKDHDETNPINEQVSKTPFKDKQEVNTLIFSKQRLVEGETRSYAMGHQENISGGTQHIKNAIKALKINEVRKHILNSFDYINYKDYTEDDIVNTLVGEGIFNDNNGNEYVDNYYYKEFGENYNQENGANLTYNGKGSDIDNLLKPNQEYKKDLNKTRKEAIDSVIYYNQNIATTDEERITFPIQIEMFCPWESTYDRPYYINLIAKMNQTLNNMPEVTEFTRDNTLINTDYTKGGFLVIPTYDIRYETNYEYVLYGGHYDISLDNNESISYNSPLSIIENYIDRGSTSGQQAITSMTNCYRLNKEKNNVIADNINEDITTLYNNALNENNNLNAKLTNIAKLDYALVHKYNLTRPLGMNNEDNKLVVSNLLTYHNSVSNYSISNYNLSKVAVLTKPLTKEERNIADQLYQQNKKEYIQQHGMYNIY